MLMRSRITTGKSAIGWARSPRYTYAPVTHRNKWLTPFRAVRALQIDAPSEKPLTYRKQLKDEKAANRAVGSDPTDSKIKTEKDLIHWELTVGLEIHAQLQTEHKLFSRAQTSISDLPNSNVSFFDLALPGSQPEFQKATLIPALRAATAFGCQIQRRSTFDRKHYFYQDQPAGYQITQYYHPFARDGNITLTRDDGIEDGPVTIGIKQIQLEQDTAKTIVQLPSKTLLDFNRVGHPLIEIITLPQIHSPRTAAACVKKIQAILQAVNAVTTGMEMGGLRADVNVSVRRRSTGKVEEGLYQFSGITGLGQRTEIKNLSSFQAVEKAIEAERDRQIDVLDAGGIIEGETRGWTLGSIETRKLRGKEGEVDYRYMPDPDLHPLIIGEDLIHRIATTMPELPDQSIHSLVNDLGLTIKDAMTLVILDDGERLEYFDAVFDELVPMAQRRSYGAERRKAASTAANWVIHELGGLLSSTETPFENCKVSSSSMAYIINHVLKSQITGRSAKKILSMVFDGDSRSVDTIIEEENLTLRGLPDETYMEMATELVNDSNNGKMVLDIREKGRMGKLQWFVGQMMRMGKGQVEAGRAEQVLKEVIGVK